MRCLALLLSAAVLLSGCASARALRADKAEFGDRWVGRTEAELREELGPPSDAVFQLNGSRQIKVKVGHPLNTSFEFYVDPEGVITGWQFSEKEKSSDEIIWDAVFTTLTIITIMQIIDRQRE